MPRHSIPEVFLALSPRQTASALGIPYQRVADAIRDGVLVVRCLGLKRRIAVVGRGGIQSWFDSRRWMDARVKPAHGERILFVAAPALQRTAPARATRGAASGARSRALRLFRHALEGVGRNKRSALRRLGGSFRQMGWRDVSRGGAIK